MLNKYKIMAYVQIQNRQKKTKKQIKKIVLNKSNIKAIQTKFEK